MTDVEYVALWAGLIASVVGIVLSIVAIVFAVLVDRGARAVSSQTIRTLQKIESEVERLSDDTRELIKAGWDKLLGNVGTPSSVREDGAVKELAAGVVAELRSELAAIAGQSQPPADQAHAIEDILRRTESNLAGQIKAETGSDSGGLPVDQALRLLEGLSPVARALAIELARRHVSRQRYRKLLRGPLAEAIEELRSAGVLVPARGVNKEGDELPVYYYPRRLGPAMRAVTSLVTAPPEDLRELVKKELERVGYYEDV